MSLLLTIALASLSPAQDAPDARALHGERSSVLTTRGWLELSGGPPYVLPLTSLSERVARPQLERGRYVRVRSLENGLFAARVLSHPPGSFVVARGDDLYVCANPTPPPAIVREGAGDLAHVVRRDGHGLVGGTLRARVPEGEFTHALLFERSPTAPRVLDLDRTERATDGTIEVPLTDAPLDAVLFVTRGEFTGEAPGKVEARDDAEMWFPIDLETEDAVTVVMYVGQKRALDPPAMPEAGGAFMDVSREVGIDFVHGEGPAEQLDIRPTMGPGAAWGDVNGDGRLDLVLLQGGGREGAQPMPDRLYLGREGGTFVDATASAGLGAGDAGMGALLVDVDGDGDLDLYCANYGPDRLFLNDGDATFTDASELLPKHDLWSASVVAADPDGDGDLDLYVTSYLDYDPAKMPPAAELGRYQREDPVEMLPFAFPGVRNVYLRNRTAETGKLAFEDATEELGLLDVQGRGMQSVFWDFDRDGDDDLYVANDVSFNVLFRNEGDGTFKDVSFSTGLDDPRGGMGLAVGDVDLDGDDDLYLTNWELESNALYLNGVVSHRSHKRRRASFHDRTVRSGMGPSGIGKTSWAAELFDLDLDGDLDLYVANGYTSPDYEGTGICVGQTDQLFIGDGSGKFRVADDATFGAASSIEQASRGAIGADFDRDGDVDLAVTANNGRALLLRNDAPRRGEWLGVSLRQAGLNTRAIGAEVVVTSTNGEVRRRSVRAGRGYLTGNAPEVHFGLGAGAEIESVTVRWPGGEETTHSAEPNRWITIER